MPTPKKGRRLGGSPAHQKAILANLATSLFTRGSITTTEAKARVLRPFAERLVTKAKRGDLHSRRQVLSVIRDKTAVHVLFTEIGPRYAERPGGYTRITKLGPRKGDNAPMAVIELVEAEFTRRSRAKSAAPAPAAEATSEESTEAVEPAGAEVPAEVAEPADADTQQPVPDEATERGEEVEAAKPEGAAAAEPEPAPEEVEAAAEDAPKAESSDEVGTGEEAGTEEDERAGD